VTSLAPWRKSVGIPRVGRSKFSTKDLKSGCRAEDAKLRTADRLADPVALFCIVSWRVLWMTMKQSVGLRRQI
jgi:hypothetical protein